MPNNGHDLQRKDQPHNGHGSVGDRKHEFESKKIQKMDLRENLIVNQNKIF